MSGEGLMDDVNPEVDPYVRMRSSIVSVTAQSGEQAISLGEASSEQVSLHACIAMVSCTLTALH